MNSADKKINMVRIFERVGKIIQVLTQDFYYLILYTVLFYRTSKVCLKKRFEEKKIVKVIFSFSFCILNREIKRTLIALFSKLYLRLIYIWKKRVLDYALRFLSVSVYLTKIYFTSPLLDLRFFFFEKICQIVGI